MMFSSPFYNYYPRYPYGRPNYYHSSFNQSIPNSSKSTTSIIEEPVSPPTEPEEKTEESRSTPDSNLINIFGLSLHFDDILLICLLLFLFQEGVEDEFLYIALLLLLLS